MTKIFRPLAVPVLALGLALLSGCGGDDGMAEVTGKVTVNGEIPAVGSSINFIPSDGKAQSAGASIENGKYSTKVPVGMSKVEIRVPRPVSRPKPGPKVGGPGPGGPSDRIEESLPPEYNNQTKLTLDVKPGQNEKDWLIEVHKK